jgi:hypothetical protein
VVVAPYTGCGQRHPWVRPSSPGTLATLRPQAPQSIFGAPGGGNGYPALFLHVAAPEGSLAFDQITMVKLK